MSLKNYDSLVDLSEHVQNMRGSLKLVLQVNDSMCKILPSTFQKSTHALYNNLEPISIQGFNDFCTKLVARFNTNIPIKKSSTKLFDVAQQEGESTWMYLNRFNEKMIKVEELLESIALEALIRGAREHVTWIKLYAFTNKSLLKVNQVMKNHKWMEEANLVRHGPPCFYKNNQHEEPSKQNHSPCINERSKKNHKGSIYGYLVYPKDL